MANRYKTNGPTGGDQLSQGDNQATFLLSDPNFTTTDGSSQPSERIETRLDNLERQNLARAGRIESLESRLARRPRSVAGRQSRAWWDR